MFELALVLNTVCWVVVLAIALTLYVRQDIKQKK
jgi:hypothetical protein